MTNGLIINGRYLSRRITGVERYAREITRRFPIQARIGRSPRRVQGMAGHLWEQFMLPGLVQEDLLWSPANSGPLAVKRQVVTIHDLTVLDHPEWFNPGFAAWYRFLIPHLAHRARKILAVSDYSRDRIISRLGLSPAKVSVIPGGVDPAQFHPIPKSAITSFRRHFRLAENYMLFLGSIEPRKNLLRLLKAWQRSSEAFPNVELVIAGGRGAQFAASGDQTEPRVHYLGYFDDTYLAFLYAGAQALLMPSLDEGFGLPALEAMACGTPVLAAASGALPEVLGGAALLVNPHSIEDIEKGIQKILTDLGLRQELITKGLCRAAQFSWDATAKQVLQALDLG